MSFINYIYRRKIIDSDIENKLMYNYYEFKYLFRKLYGKYNRIW